MADQEQLLLQAKSVYETFCSALDDEEWHYTRHDEDLVITCGAKGGDLAMDFYVLVDAERQVITLFSPLPFKMSEGKRVEGALVVNVANYGMTSGSFDYDLSDGEIRFRMTNSYRGSIIGKELFLAMVYTAASTVDRYNDKFLAVSTGVMSVEQFLEWEQQ